MNPKLTDDAVADLPLHHGRAELLEEIMRTPVLDDRPVQTPARRRRTGWLVPAAAAVAVAAVVAGVAWWGGTGGDPHHGGDRSGQIASQPTAAPNYRAVLDAPGWAVTYAYAEADDGEVTYENGDRTFEISWYPADSYQSYVEDRRHITEPPTDGEPIEVLGRDAQMWAYARTDHTAIRTVDAGHWLELRGGGMDETAYVALLARLRLVDQAGFEAAMPASFVDGTERRAAVDDILAGIARYAEPLFPPDGPRDGASSDQTDPYHLGADVAGAVACAWLDEFAEAHRKGDDARAQRAADVLATSRQWPVLKEMAERGDYPEVVWDYADQVAAGRVPEYYKEGLGCEG